MSATITEFRKDLFRMADQAMHGANVTFIYKGVVFEVKPEKKISKLEKLVGQPVVAEGVDLDVAGKELFAEMQSEWAKDWADL